MRLFIAIAVPTALHRYCRQMQAQYEGVNITNDFHLTLQFLGDDTDDPAPVMATLSQIRFKSFEIEMGDAVPFGPKDDPHGVWIECAQNKELNTLAATIQERLKPLGYVSDKPFKAHITLGRYKMAPHHPAQRQEGLKHRFNVDHFELIQSHLGSGGPQYKTLGVYKSSPVL